MSDDLMEVKTELNGVKFNGLPLTDKEKNIILGSNFFDLIKNCISTKVWTILRLDKGRKIENLDGTITVAEKDEVLIVGDSFKDCFFSIQGNNVVRSEV